MQPHSQDDPKPPEPKPGERTTRWLILAIAILLGLVAWKLLDRFL
ncbi:MAG TPA: hypothetical protein VE443_13275 [Beijerinckiaceae bacterium]|jgi:hypothetical protein|nr:hypothetical protein [Microvirga sp.]HZB38953.1 hypothetical protein [Beijerinckiaceae bacterium]